MTTGGGDHSPDTQHPASPALWLVGVGLAAVLVGVQGLAASTPFSRDVLMLLPSEGILAGVGDGLRRGYGLAMEQARSCGIRPPSLGLGWLPPGEDPQPVLATSVLPELLIAPPAVPLLPFGNLAQREGINVLLPLQRGDSVQRLPSQVGADRLWPVLPSRSLEADRLARGLIEQGRAKVMVIHDGGSQQAALADRFVDTIGGGGGWVVGASNDPVALPRPEAKALQQLRDDVDWYRPEALVVMTAPDSPLARAVARLELPAELTLVWPFPVRTPLRNAQLGVDPLSRGPGWKHFDQVFQRTYGYGPGLVEAAGYDTGQLVALSSQGKVPQRFWDLLWLDPKARPLDLCPALAARRAGRRVALKGAASRLDLAPGIAPSAELRLTPLAADASAAGS